MHAVLSAIIDGQEAWASVPDLAKALDVTAESICDDLADLNEQGWVEVWEHPAQGPLVTLSAWGAEQLGVHLVESGQRRIVLRWLPDAASAKRGPRPRPCNAKAELLEQVVSREPSVEAWAEAFETVILKFKPKLHTLEQLPWPTALVYDTDPAWPREGEFDRINRLIAPTSLVFRQNPQKDRICTGCGGRKLRTSELCLHCSRWGFDGVFNAILKAEQAARKDGVS